MGWTGQSCHLMALAGANSSFSIKVWALLQNNWNSAIQFRIFRQIPSGKKSLIAVRGRNSLRSLIPSDKESSSDIINQETERRCVKHEL